jgi:hypothetical protein
MQAQVERFKGWLASGRPNRNNEEVGETLIRPNNEAAVNSGPNWQTPGGTSEQTGGPVKAEPTFDLEDIVQKRDF